MKKLILLLLLSSTVLAQPVVYFGQKQPDKPTTNCITPALEKQIQAQTRAYRAGARSKAVTAGPVLFDWPLRQRAPLDYTYYGFVAFVDNNPATNAILDYNGGNRTYDGHTGTDIGVQPFPWDMLDNSRVEVIAAAAGTIIIRQDGNFDRQCNPNPANGANMVVIQHEDGTTTRYLHMKNGSVTSKGVGQTVQLGEYLGIVASSGNSAGPHLHFEIRDASNNIIDPFAGPSNPTTATSRWIAQKPYWDPKIGRLMTHSAEPVFIAPCTANPADVTNEKRSFVSGSTVHFGFFGRDWQPNQVFTIKIIRPDGTAFQDFQYTRQADYLPFAFTANAFPETLPNPAQTGRWKFQITTLGITTETVFNVNTTSPYAATTTLCSGNGIELTAMNGGQNFTYQWRRNGSDIGGATSDRYTATLAGVYTVVATFNSSSSVSDPLTITSATSLTTLKAGNWSDPTVWSCGQIPLITNAVSLNHLITIPTSFTARAQRILLGAGGKLIYNGSGSVQIEP
ncbi:peptidoglycan DD-metalloendopeptidase family protein [Spirosoma sp. BT702]|uniref:Peptidoglycan DD-metalloendopeptidase family protein n=1 Tax=Spirosoma profusum TaxID=2771354 RepID=A0A927AV03_9BACT|nr:peptidoglycan DD-metalloendopeptidase family protein [Spirosoma profusum]MBD2704896.1 peptidoglycan DD-metalloendopeptidase family protein [Spirosoma profusum]